MFVWVLSVNVFVLQTTQDAHKQMREESTLRFGKMRGFNMKLYEKESKEHLQKGVIEKGDIEKKHAFIFFVLTLCLGAVIKT